MNHMPQAALPQRPPVPTDAPLDTIPGLGVIRVRALKKAGWVSTGTLQSATIADLTAVPGITPNKAKVILDYVRHTNGKPASSAGEQAGERVRQTAAKVVSAACGLLSSEQADVFDARFARQLGKMAAFAERLDPERLADPERALGHLEKAAVLLADAISAGHLGARRQQKLADELRSRRRKVRDLFKPAA